MKQKLKQYMNDIKMIIESKQISLSDLKQIDQLIKIMKILKEENCWKDFKKKKYSEEYKIFRRLRLEKIDEELFEVIYGLRRKFNILEMAFNLKIKSDLLNEIKKTLSDKNVYKKLIDSKHNFYNDYKKLVLQEIPDCPDLDLNKMSFGKDN